MGDEETFDMGEAGTMTQEEIDVRFKDHVEKIPSLIRPEVDDITPDRRRALVKAFLNEPSDDSVRREVAAIEERAAMRVDDKDLRGKIQEGVDKINTVLERFGPDAKVVGLEVKARIVDPTSKRMVIAGLSGGTVADRAPMVLHEVESVLEMFNEELDQKRPESLKTFLGMLESDRANKRIVGLLETRAAQNIMDGELAAGRSPEDSPALGKALTIKMGKDMIKSALMQKLGKLGGGGGGGLGDLMEMLGGLDGNGPSRLDAMRKAINPNGELCTTCDKEDCEDRKNPGANCDQVH